MAPSPKITLTALFEQKSIKLSPNRTTKKSGENSITSTAADSSKLSLFQQAMAKILFKKTPYK